MIGSGTNGLASGLPEVGAREVLESSDIITGGTFHPRGAAVRRSDGYVLRERWPFASQRALVRLAAVHAFRACADAVDLCFEAGGGSSVYDGSTLQRAFRDVHTAGQHITLACTGYETVGRVLLGMDPDTPLL